MDTGLIEAELNGADRRRAEERPKREPRNNKSSKRKLAKMDLQVINEAGEAEGDKDWFGPLAATLEARSAGLKLGLMRAGSLRASAHH